MAHKIVEWVTFIGTPIGNLRAEDLPDELCARMKAAKLAKHGRFDRRTKEGRTLWDDIQNWAVQEYFREYDARMTGQ